MIRSMRLLSLFYLVAGTLHFLRPRTYEAIMPAALPAKRELVYASGLAEIVGGAGVLHPATRRPHEAMVGLVELALADHLPGVVDGFGLGKVTT